MAHSLHTKDINPNGLEYLAYAATGAPPHCSASAVHAYSTAAGDMQYTQVRHSAPYFNASLPSQQSHPIIVQSPKDLTTLVCMDISQSVPNGESHSPAVQEQYSETSTSVQGGSMQKPLILGSAGVTESYSSVYAPEKTDNCVSGSMFELQKVPKEASETFSENAVSFASGQRVDTKPVFNLPQNNQSFFVPYSIPNQLECQSSPIQWTSSLSGPSAQLITPGVVFPHYQLASVSPATGAAAAASGQVYAAKQVISAPGQLISINPKPNVIQLHALSSDGPNCIEENSNIELVDKQLNAVNYVPSSVYQFGGACYAYSLQKKSTEDGAPNFQSEEMCGQPESVVYSPDFQAYGKTVVVKPGKNTPVTASNCSIAEKSQSPLNVLSSSSEFIPNVAGATTVPSSSLPMSYSFASPMRTKSDQLVTCDGQPNSMVVQSDASSSILVDAKTSRALVLELTSPYVPMETSSTPIISVSSATVTRAINRPLIAKRTTSSSDDSSAKISDAATSVAGDRTAPPAPSKSTAKASQSLHTCQVCSNTFTKLYTYKRHLKTHGLEKRGSLNMKSKLEIIRRSKAGERVTDLALEYNAGKSTLLSIVKNSEMYLKLQEGGTLCADRKRLRKAEMEDVEEAVYLWYKQVTEMNTPISGPKLCKKAKEFAVKLGHKDFKASNGWLDRFKHRKNVQIPRNVKPIKTSLAGFELPDFDNNPQDFDSVVLPTLLLEHNARDVFFADEFGIFFSSLPDDYVDVSRVRCCNGGLSSKRLTVLACCNMNGSEKLPLVVIGRYRAPDLDELGSKLPLQYNFNSKSWMTTDCFKNWLREIDALFHEKNRKVLLLFPTSPVHPIDVGLSTIKVISTPPTFKGPMKLGICKSIKQQYRRSVIELILDSLDSRSGKRERSESINPVSLVQALHFLSRSWQNISTPAISSSFLRAGFNKYSPWSVNDTCNISIAADNLELLHSLKENGFKIEPQLTFNDFISFDDTVQVCHVMDDDAIISTVTAKAQSLEESESELDDVGKPFPLTIPRSKLEIKSNSARLSSSPEKTSLIQKNSLLSSLQFLKSHIQKRTDKCPELGSVFYRLHGLIENSLVEIPANVTAT